MPGSIELTGKFAVVAKKMLKRVTSILDKSQISYILDYGTLLGIVREKRLLPWDTDMDISITDRDLSKLLKIRWKFWLYGYRTRVRRYKADVGAFKKGEIKIFKLQTTKYFFLKDLRLMDIFVKKELNDEYIYSVGNAPVFVKSVPKEYHENLTQIQFDNKMYSVPKQYEDYLTFVYGDWKTPVKDWDFRTSDNCVTETLNYESTDVTAKYLRDFADLLDKANIPYYLDHGTLLGLIRNKTLLPVEPFLNLNILEVNLSRMLLNKFIFFRKGFLVKVRRFKNKNEIFEQNDVRVLEVYVIKKFFPNYQKVISIFVNREADDEYHHFIRKNPPFLKSAPKQMLQEFIQMKFEGKKYSIPKQYNDYLTHLYGDWKNVSDIYLT